MTGVNQINVCRLPPEQKQRYNFSCVINKQGASGSESTGKPMITHSERDDCHSHLDDIYLQI